MATTKIRGTDGQIYQGATKIGARSAITFTATMGEADASDHDSGGWGETITTTASATADVNGFALYDSSTKAWDTLQASLMAACVAGTALAFSIYPSGSGAGKAQITGNFRITRFDVGAPQDGVQPFNFTLKNVGAVTIGNQ